MCELGNDLRRVRYPTGCGIPDGIRDSGFAFWPVLLLHVRVCVCVCELCACAFVSMCELVLVCVWTCWRAYGFICVCMCVRRFVLMIFLCVC